MIEQVYADVFGCENALVRQQIVNGTHALAIGLYGLLRPGDTLLSVADRPYDTLEEVIGLSGTPGNGSLKDFGIDYEQVNLKPDGSPDYGEIEKKLTDQVKVVFIQRSKGYLTRPTLSVDTIGEIHLLCEGPQFRLCDGGQLLRGIRRSRRSRRPVGADLMAGSLIKNPGGGMAESGGYLCGTRRDLVEQCRLPHDHSRA